MFADKPGDRVWVVDPAGAKYALSDGTVVDVLQTSADEDVAEDMRLVAAGDKKGLVSSRHVVWSHHVRTAPKDSPAAAFAVVTPEVSCSDLCSSVVWLARGLGERWKIFGESLQDHLEVAWHPDGTQVAIGYGGDGIERVDGSRDTQLVVIELPSGQELAKSDAFFAPAYSPDGLLHVRSADWSVHTWTDGKATKVGEGKPQRMAEGDHIEPIPKPVTFDRDGKYKLQD